jgi:hypothetical protein
VLFAISIILSFIGFFYAQRIAKCFIRRWKQQKEPLVGTLSRREAIQSAGVIDYKHMNPTSCEEVRHKDLSAPLHEDHPPSMFETPQLHRADTNAPVVNKQYPQQRNPEHHKQNPFVRSMSLYANAFPDDRN